MTDSVELSNLASDFADARDAVRYTRLALDRAIIEADQQGLSVAGIVEALDNQLTSSYVFTVLVGRYPDRRRELETTLPEDDGTGINHAELASLTPLPPLALIEMGFLEFVRAGTTTKYRIDPSFLANVPAPQDLRRI